MEIVVKVIKEDGSKSLVYLMDYTGVPLEADMVSSEDVDKVINKIINNNPSVNKDIKKINYSEYIIQE
jgi:hypothetical protein